MIFFIVLVSDILIDEYKRGCVFPMVIWPEFRMRQYSVNDHPYNASQFIARLQSTRTIKFLSLLKLTNSATKFFAILPNIAKKLPKMTPFLQYRNKFCCAIDRFRKPAGRDILTIC